MPLTEYLSLLSKDLEVAATYFFQLLFAPIPNGGAYRPNANNEQVIR